MNEPFLFSVPSGDPVDLEVFHYAIVGQTQFSGKTTLIKRLAEWASSLDYDVLIFDTKPTEPDYQGFGSEIPVCLRETNDSFVLIGLLESMFKRRLTPYYATLSRLTEGASGFGDIITRAKELESKTKSGWLKDACRVLYDLLERLQAETSKVHTVPQLRLVKGINRMVLNDFSLEAQQLIVKNAFEDGLRVYKKNLILVLDEAFNFLPQGYSSAASRPVMQVITQGAKTGLYVWISTQFLAVTDKDPLKACAFKFLGTQDHKTEVKHTLDLVPEAKGRFSDDDVMRLKLGHWILVRKRPPDVRVIYVSPVGVPVDVAQKVSKGEISPEFIRDNYLKKKSEEDDEMFRERYEKEKKLREDVESRLKETQVLIVDLKDANQKLNDSIGELESIKAEKAKADEYLGLLTKDFEVAKAEAKKFDEERIQDLEKLMKATKDSAKLRRFVEAFRDLLEPTLLQQIFENPEYKELLSALKGGPTQGSTQVNLTTESLKFKLTTSERTIDVDASKDWAGKILQVMINDLDVSNGVSSADIARALQEHGWHRDERSVRGDMLTMIRQGLIIKDRNGYRLPIKITFQETKKEDK